jgi:hypothetical protein
MRNSGLINVTLNCFFDSKIWENEKFYVKRQKDLFQFSYSNFSWYFCYFVTWLIRYFSWADEVYNFMRLVASYGRRFLTRNNNLLSFDVHRDPSFLSFFQIVLCKNHFFKAMNIKLLTSWKLRKGNSKLDKIVFTQSHELILNWDLMRSQNNRDL